MSWKLWGEKKGPFKQDLNQSHVPYLIWEDIHTDADASFFRWSFIQLRKFEESYKYEWLLFLLHTYSLSVQKSLLRPFLLLIYSLRVAPRCGRAKDKYIISITYLWYFIHVSHPVHLHWSFLSSVPRVCVCVVIVLTIILCRVIHWIMPTWYIQQVLCV